MFDAALNPAGPLFPACQNPSHPPDS